MTLGAMKTKVFNLIEEASSTQGQYTDDPDFALKVEDIINQIILELVRIKKIPAYKDETVSENEAYLLTTKISDFYQLNKITGVEYEREETLVTFTEAGTARIHYWRYPTEPANDNSNLDAPADVLSIVPYGVAADILKSDVSNQYGTIYANRYTELKNGLDPRFATASITIEDGIDI